MVEPFRDRPPRKRGLGMGAGRRKKAFLEELETLLASAASLSAVDASAARALAHDHGLDLGSDVTTARRGLFRRFLEYCLNDYALSADELADLAHLQSVLALEDLDAEIAKGEAVHSVYGQALDDVLADYHLDPEEKEFLQRLRGEVGLSDDAAEAMLADGKARARERFIKDALVHDSSVVSSQETQLDLDGESETSLEAAIQNAIARATEVVPEVRSATLRDLRVEVSDGEVSRWSVVLRARL